MVLVIAVFLMLASGIASAACEFDMQGWHITLTSEPPCLDVDVIGFAVPYQYLGTIPVSIAMGSTENLALNFYLQSKNADKPLAEYNFEALALAAAKDSINVQENLQTATVNGRKWGLAAGLDSLNTDAYVGSTLLDDYTLFSVTAFDKGDLEDAIKGFTAVSVSTSFFESESRGGGTTFSL